VSKKQPSPGYIILYAGAVAAVFTAAIVALQVSTAGIVERNQRLLTERAVVDIFRLADVSTQSDAEIARLFETRVAGSYAAVPDENAPDPRRRPVNITDPQTGRNIPLLVAYKQDLPADAPPPDPLAAENVVGYAFPLEGIGFWASIRGWMAVTPDAQTVLGVAFLQHQETPGLGGRITEPEFREQFQGIRLADPGRDGRYIYIDKNPVESDADPRKGRHVNAITGATGTSQAVSQFVNENIAAFRRAMAAAQARRPAGEEQ